MKDRKKVRLSIKIIKATYTLMILVGITYVVLKSILCVNYGVNASDLHCIIAEIFAMLFAVLTIVCCTEVLLYKRVDYIIDQINQKLKKRA